MTSYTICSTSVLRCILKHAGVSQIYFPRNWQALPSTLCHYFCLFFLLKYNIYQWEHCVTLIKQADSEVKKN